MCPRLTVSLEAPRQLSVGAFRVWVMWLLNSLKLITQVRRPNFLSKMTPLNTSVVLLLSGFAPLNLHLHSTPAVVLLTQSLVYPSILLNVISTILSYSLWEDQKLMEYTWISIRPTSNLSCNASMSLDYYSLALSTNQFQPRSPYGSTILKAHQPSTSFHSITASPLCGSAASGASSSSFSSVPRSDRSPPPYRFGTTRSRCPSRTRSPWGRCRF